MLFAPSQDMAAEHEVKPTATEEHLEQAHYLLAATYRGDGHCQILPITYDFCWFAVAAEFARRQRVFDILMPIAALLPTQDGITLLASRKVASRLADDCYGRTFPEHYFPQFPGPDKPFAGVVCDAARKGEQIPSLRAPEAALQFVKEWRQRVCEERPVVTITLRYSPYLLLRNSNLDAWATVAQMSAAIALRSSRIRRRHCRVRWRGSRAWW